MITTKNEKKAIYGAIQRVLNKMAEKYPYNSKDFGFEVGYCPDTFGFEIGLVPNIMEICEDYTEYFPELGNTLLQELMDSKIAGVCPNKERFFVEDIEFDTGDSDGKG